MPRSSINRELPCVNHIVQERTDRRAYQLHMDRLRRTKPSIDNRPSRVGEHLKMGNAKRAQLQYERTYTIEYENSLLLEKMRRIMDLGTVASNSGDTSGMGVDPRSLNAGKRRRELQRITNENMGIVKRIQESQSMYDPQRWDADRKETEQVLRRISRFKPRADMSSSQHISSMSAMGMRQEAPRPFHLPPLTHPGHGRHQLAADDDASRLAPRDADEGAPSREGPFLRPLFTPPPPLGEAPYEGGEAGEPPPPLLDDSGVPLRDMELELRFAKPADADWAEGPWVRLKLLPRY